VNLHIAGKELLYRSGLNELAGHLAPACGSFISVVAPNRRAALLRCNDAPALQTPPHICFHAPFRVAVALLFFI
jgi:hypothetical protein